MTPTPIPCIQDGQKDLAHRSGRAFALRAEPLRVSSVPASIPRVLRFICLRLSLWRGYRRQRIAREIRSADVKRGLARNHSKGATR